MSILPNKEQVEGNEKQVAGRTEQAVGAATDDTETRAKGLGKAVEGKAEEVVGNIKKAIHDATK